jgi:hypothetical protein
MFRPIDRSTIINKPGRPSRPGRPVAPTYQVIYILNREKLPELTLNGEKIKRRTAISAGQFKSRFLSASAQTNMTVFGSLGSFIVFSHDSELLASLPQHYGSFQRGAVDRVRPEQRLKPL